MKKGENTFCKRKCYLFKGILASPSFIFIAKKNLCFLYAFVGSIAQVLFFETQSVVLLSSLLANLGILWLTQLVHYISDLNLQMTKEFQRTFEPYIQ